MSDEEKDEPIVIPADAFRYVMTLLAGVGIGFAITVLAIWLAVRG